MSSISEPFIRRPIATSLLSVALLLAGGVALLINPVTTQVKRLQHDVPGLQARAPRP